MMHEILRRQVLLDKIKEKGFIYTSELLEISEASNATLQRDLNYLEKLGQIVRSHGAVEYLASKQTVVSERNLKYNTRKLSHAREKSLIGRATQELIEDNDIIYLGHGTTTVQVARMLPNDKDLTVVTDGLDIIYELEYKPNIRVITTGGTVNYNSRHIEPDTHGTEMRNVNLTKMIIGVGGISKVRGFTFYDSISCKVIEQKISRCNEIIIVADHSKFGKFMLESYLTFEKVNYIVTDEKTEKDYIQFLEKKGIKVLVAK